MAAPVVTFYEDDDLTELNNSNPLDFGTVDAATTSDEIEFHIWNNKGGGTIVSDMENVRITEVTKNGLSSGDGAANGEEMVEDKWLLIKSLTNSETTFTAVGGATTHTLDDISGAVSGACHEVVGKVAIPSDATAGQIESKTRILYQYT